MTLGHTLSFPEYLIFYSFPGYFSSKVYPPSLCRAASPGFKEILYLQMVRGYSVFIYVISEVLRNRRTIR